MKKTRYWTDFDKKLFRSLRRWLSSLDSGILLFIRRGFSFSVWESVFLLILAVAVACRAAGFASGGALPEEIRHLHQSTNILSAASRFQFEGDSFYGLLLCLSSFIPMALGMAHKTVPAFLFLNYEGAVTWIYPGLLLAGRVLNLALFAVALYLIFRLCARFFSERAGALAALFLAFSPLCVQVSRFLLPANASLLWTALFFYCALLWRENRRPAPALYAGIFFGLLAATSFYGVFLAPFVFLAFVLFSWRAGAAFAAGGILSYFAATFYDFGDVSLRLDNLAQQIILRRDYFHASAPNLVSWFLAASILASLVLFISEKRKRSIFLFFWSFLLLFLALFSSFLRRAPEDLSIALIPAVLLSALFWDWLLGKARSAGLRTLIWAAVVLAAAWEMHPSLFCSPLFARQLQPLSQAASDFSPGPWKKDVILRYQPPHDFIKQGVLQTYEGALRPVPLTETRVATFLARAKKLKSVVIPFENRKDQPLAVQLDLMNGKGEVLKKSVRTLPAGGWRDVEFLLGQELSVGKRYFWAVEKTSPLVNLPQSDKNILLESAATNQDRIPNYDKHGDGEADYLFMAIYE